MTNSRAVECLRGHLKPLGLLKRVSDSGGRRTSGGPRRTSGGLRRTSKLRHFSIFATSLTLDLAGVEYIPGNLVYLYYFVADSDIHIECESMDIFSADNPSDSDIEPGWTLCGGRTTMPR